jgi:hypothetical protein
MNRYYADCLHTNYCGVEDDPVMVIVDARTEEAAITKIHNKYHIDSIVRFSHIQPIHRYSNAGKRIRHRN